MKPCELNKYKNISIQSIGLKFHEKTKAIDLASVGILFFVFYIFTQRWFELYLRSGISQLAIVFFALLFLLIGTKTKRSEIISISTIDLLWFPGIILILFHIAYINLSDYLFNFFTYSSAFVFLLLAKVEIKDYRAALFFMKGASIIYALGTITQYLFTDSFNNFIFMHVELSVQNGIINLLQEGYYPGLGFNSPGVAAAYMVLGLGLIFYFWKEGTRRQKIIDGVFTTIIAIAIVIAGQRSTLLWMVASLSIIYIVAGVGKEKLWRIIRLLIFGVTFVSILFIIMITFGAGSYMPRLEVLLQVIFDGKGLLAIGSIQSRVTLAQAAWEFFLANPLLGVGWGQFEVLTSGLLKQDYKVHNIYLQLLSEMGLLGFTAVMVPMVYTYIRTFKAISVLIKNSFEIGSLWKPVMLFSFYYQTYFFLFGLTESPFYNLIPVFTYFLFVSVVNSYIVFVKSIARTD